MGATKTAEPATTRTAGGLNARGILGALAAAFVANVVYGLFTIYEKHFYTQDLGKWTVEDLRTNTTWIRKDVPITYYRIGEIDKVLPKGGWLTSNGDDGMHVFRLYPEDRDRWDIDLSMIKSKQRIMEVNEDCINKHGWATCPGESCQVRGQEVKSGYLEDILLANSSKYYGSFAQIDLDAIDYLESSMKLPFKMNRGRFEQSFCSNFKNDIFGTPIHSNPFTHSLAIQYVGRKSWIIFDSEVYTAKDGLASTALYAPFMPMRAPRREKTVYWTYKSMPGDFFYFPPNYGHAVLTHPGPNLMVNFRNPMLKQSLANWVNVLHGLLNTRFFNEPSKNVLTRQDGDAYDPNRDESPSMIRAIYNFFARKTRGGPKVSGGMTIIMREYLDFLEGLACDDDDPTNMNLILTRLIQEVADTVP